MTQIVAGTAGTNVATPTAHGGAALGSSSGSVSAEAAAGQMRVDPDQRLDTSEGDRRMAGCC
jgi:hypothetical protein